MSWASRRNAWGKRALLWALLLGWVALPAPLARAQARPGFTHAASMQNAAHHEPGAPDVVVHAPPGFDPRSPLSLVVFLHGYRGCANVLMGAGSRACRPGDSPQLGWDLASRHDEASTGSLFVIPQLAFMRRSGRPGCFARDGCFRRFLDELLGTTLAPWLGPGRSLDDVASITLVAHSAGYETALAILEHGDVAAKVRDVVLMDALYGGAGAFAHWLEHAPRPDARLVSIHLGRGKTREQSEALYRRLRRILGAEQVARVGPGGIADAVASHRAVVASGEGAHRLVPDRYLAEVLGALWRGAGD